MILKNDFTRMLNIDFPIIMAPMFLVSNASMMKAAMECGIAGSFPSLNYREDGELDRVLDELNTYKSQINKGTYGVNIIVQRSNPLLNKHLDACVKARVPFYITSLGKPDKVIEAAHAYGAKVFCDVTNIAHAEICANLGCDGFIAVGQGAGGHAGPNPLQILVPSLKKRFPNMPVIPAGGIASGQGIVSMLALGASAVSIGTRFIASKEAGVNEGYKQAIVNSKMEDIVMTERLSGTPSTIINTPQAKKMGYKQNWFERAFAKNSKTKKYFKMLIQLKGMKKLEQSIKPGNYKSLWIAGQSVELIDEVLSVQQIIDKLTSETRMGLSSLSTMHETIIPAETT